MRNLGPKRTKRRTPFRRRNTPDSRPVEVAAAVRSTGAAHHCAAGPGAVTACGGVSNRSASTRTGEWHVTTQRARSVGNSPWGGTRSVTDDKPSPPRRGGPGGRRVLPPSGRPVAREVDRQEWRTRARRVAGTAASARGTGPAVLGVKPHTAAGQLRQPESDRSSFTGG
ncbi:Hypothetical protein SLIV_31597 [Streptomyces lividans TK24]|uniref:Uncharacterized protein n=1 Tax=Streptomyces lividans TK24 TaxID=457428 RepID=A0ABX6TRM9_STRLI|nr:Hypothetical protein SLIV_31597 [Streptomyces lividans TK24]QSJ12811.1 Hypothetical protein SLIVDG2_31597 [Streptomyces lividans]QTD73721.1 Hypothetical protein SLIVYQS_31597 [Streptomyces lividans TK24] [Streptomyces lividans]